MDNFTCRERKLPIAMEPFIRAYPQYCFLDGIMNNSYRTGNCLAKIRIENDNFQKWNMHFRGATYKVEQNTIEIEQEKYILDSEKVIYRNFSEISRVEFHIDYQQYTNRWDGIYFFVGDREKDISDLDDQIFLFGRFCDGACMNSLNKKGKFFSRSSYSKYKWFCIEVEDACIKVSASENHEQWDMICQEELHVNSKENLIGGFNFIMENHQYYKWLFNNFIQLRYNAGDGVKLEYTCFVKRDWRNYTINPIVKFSFNKVAMLSELNINIYDYIRANINNEQYMEFWLNEYYLPDLKAYQNYQFMHESLVYGYDDRDHSIYLVAIQGGKPVDMKVSYQDFVNAFEHNIGGNDTIYSLEYNPTNDPYELDFIHILWCLEDYLYGRNSTDDYNHLMPRERGVFGLSLYQEILENDINKEAFLLDRRIAYLLSEHKKCMYERISMLCKLNIYSEEQSKYLLGLAETIYNDSVKVLSLVLKNGLSSKQGIQDKIWNYLIQLRDNEQLCYKYITNLAYLI